jgi:hypothetical protein
MPDQLFTYYIEKSLGHNIYKQWKLVGGVMVIRLDMESLEIGKGGTKKGDKKRGGWVGVCV